MTAESGQPVRAVDLSVEVKAPASAVWQAITNAEELMRWFPPVARVEPGAGGSIFLSWGDGMEGQGTIEVWEPNRALRVKEPSGMAVDYWIEVRGTATVLRVVHSGFGADASFDDQYEGTLEGWRYFLFNLKHYLERHWGQPRHLISVRRPMSISREDAWSRLMSEDGLAVSPWPVASGARCSIRLGQQRYTGQVATIRGARSLTITIEELNDATLFVELESGGANWHCGLWLSVYGARPDVDSLRGALEAVAEAGSVSPMNSV
jgi:uncharacterized protein YndB with AHSA1/START domain